MSCNGIPVPTKFNRRVPGDVLSQLVQLGGLTFYKDFTGSGSLHANYSLGDPTATFTCDCSATNPRTYVDANGVIQLVTTANVGLIWGGYYDATGFHKLSKPGLGVFAQGANLLIRTDGTASGSGLWTGWQVSKSCANDPTTTQVLCPTLSGITNAAAQRFVYVDGADTNKSLMLQSTNTVAGSVVEGNVVTFSFYARSQTGTTGANFIGQINWRDSVPALIGSETSSALTLTSSWRKFSVTGTAPATTNRISAKVGFNNGVDQGDLLDFEVYGMQVEINPYPTPFIPTTTGALTRNAETLTYLIAGNRTAAQETISIGFMPMGGSFANDGVARVVLNNTITTSSNTDNRVIDKATSGVVLRSYPAGYTGTNKSGTTTPLVNTPYVFTSSCNSTGNPNLQIFLNGVQESTDSNTDFTPPPWTTTFYIGSDRGSINQLNGLFTGIAIHSRALTAGEVATEYALLK
jgi:hypothetical protein